MRRGQSSFDQGETPLALLGRRPFEVESVAQILDRQTRALRNIVEDHVWDTEAALFRRRGARGVGFEQDARAQCASPCANGIGELLRVSSACEIVGAGSRPDARQPADYREIVSPLIGNQRIASMADAPTDMVVCQPDHVIAEGVALLAFVACLLPKISAIAAGNSE